MQGYMEEQQQKSANMTAPKETYKPLVTNHKEMEI